MSVASNIEAGKKGTQVLIIASSIVTVLLVAFFWKRNVEIKKLKN